MRRLVGTLLMDQTRPKVSIHPLSMEAEVATPGGAEAIVHAASIFPRADGQDESLGVLKEDLRNSFNLVICPALLREV